MNTTAQINSTKSASALKLEAKILKVRRQWLKDEFLPVVCAVVLVVAVAGIALAA